MDDDGGRLHRLELLSTILLAVAAVMTAWATYQSNQWRGETAIKYSKATAARIQSSAASTRAGQLTQVDIATFVQWLDARAQRLPRLAAFYRERFRPEFEPAFSAWLATRPFGAEDAPLTPFAMPQYRLKASAEAARLERQAATASTRAQVANQHANDYMLGVVLFATALFFAGISAKMHSLGVRAAMLGLGCFVFLAAAIWLLTLPVQLS